MATEECQVGYEAGYQDGWNAAQQPQAEVGNSGFDHKTAADFLSGKTVSDEAVRKFVQASRWAHDDRASLQSMLLSVRNELASRDAEIALLKKELMAADAAPRQAESVPPSNLIDPGTVVSFAVDRWLAEVANRPLVNKNRRTLDDTWRQVIRRFGGDPNELLGPSHDELAAIAQQKGSV